MKDPNAKPFCTWPKVVVFFLALSVGVAMVFVFAPIDRALDRVIPDFNRSDDETFVPPTLPPGAGGGGGGEGPKIDYQFFQCQNFSNGCCNDLETICDLRVNEIMYATAHNAMSSREGGLPTAFNHYYALERSLEAGYRGLSLDICNCTGQLQFCHTVCTIGARDPAEVFVNVVRFLEQNPTEILMFVFQVENSVGGSPVSLRGFYDLMTAVSGLIDMLYVHPDSDTEWPTLRTLVNSNKRIIMFHHDGPNCTNPDDCPAGLHYYFRYAADTDFEVDTVQELAQVSSSCNITRGSRTSSQFFTVNHFLKGPNPAAASTINEYNFLRNRLRACSNLNAPLGQPSMVLVDFWSIGDLPNVTQQHNMELASQRRRMVNREEERRIRLLR